MDSSSPGPSNKTQCAHCKKFFVSLLRHIAQKETCESNYPEDQLTELRANAKSRTAKKKAEKRKLRPAPSQSTDKRAQYDKTYHEKHRKERLQVFQSNYQKNKSKIAQKYKENTKNLQNFFKEIQHGPIFPCISCMRCLPLKSVTKLTDNFYQKLVQNDTAKYVCREPHLQIDDRWHLCKTCYRNLAKGYLPSQCHENGLQLAPVPDCLKVSDVGNQLLAKNLVFIKV